MLLNFSSQRPIIKNTPTFLYLVFLRFAKIPDYKYSQKKERAIDRATIYQKEILETKKLKHKQLRRQNFLQSHKLSNVF